MLRKFLVALLSSIVFCVSLAALKYTPVIDRQPDTYYTPFTSLVLIFLIYATPVYLLGGVPASMLIDWISRKMNLSHVLLRYMFEAIAYMIAGALSSIIFLAILSGGTIFFAFQDSNGFIEFGVIAALVYHHLYLLSYRFGK